MLLRSTRLSLAALLFLAASALGQVTAPVPMPAPAEIQTHECRRVIGKIKIDGKADEPAWKQAPVIDDFSASWIPRPTRSKTSARLLWDDEALYFYAEMEDTDLYADITEHDDQTWNNDVFELFFKPRTDNLGYYEFQVTPANVRLDMFLASRGSGHYRRWARERPFTWQTAVALFGTINKYQDTDTGWSAEGRIPWKDFAPTGGAPSVGDQWRFALCRYDYAVRYESPDLSTSARLTRPDFHRYEDYSWLKFVGPAAEK